MGASGVTLAGYTLTVKHASANDVIQIKELKPDKDVIGYIRRIKGGFDQTSYQQVIAALNAFKKGGHAIGVSAEDEATRQNEWVMGSADKYLFCGENVSFPHNYHEILFRHGNRQGEYDSNSDIRKFFVFLLFR